MMKRGRRRHQYNDDRLSNLPDCVLVYILSFLSINEAVLTGLLSRRWKHLWKRLQTLSFTDGYPFRCNQDFSRFVTLVLSLHDASTALITLEFQNVFPVRPHLLETIETFAALRNQNLKQNLKRLSLFYCRVQRIPNFLFSCHSLESLTLRSKISDSDHVVFPDFLILPALTYLNLRGLVFRSKDGDDGRAKPFSLFNKLNSLIIKHCRPEENVQTLCISNAMLVDLVIHTLFQFSNIELSAPSLCTFTFNAKPHQKLSGSSLSCVKHVTVEGYVTHLYHAGVIPTWLIQLVNLESLTIFSDTLQAFFKFPDFDLFKSKHTSWSNLKLLRVLYTRKEYMHEQILIMMRSHKVAGGKPWKGNVKLREGIKALEPYASIPDGAIDFFIQNSPSANVDILLPKEPKGYYFL